MCAPVPCSGGSARLSRPPTPVAVADRRNICGSGRNSESRERCPAFVNSRPKMGLQIPRGVHSQIPQEGAVRGAEAVPGRCVPQVGFTEGKPDRGRPPHAGSCAHDDIDPTEIRSFAGGRFHQGQECDPLGTDVWREETQFSWDRASGPEGSSYQP